MNTDAAHKTAAAEAAAARWMACRDRGMSEAEHVAFATWHDADPIHAEQWRRAEAIWAELTRLDTEPTRKPSRLPRRSVTWMAMAACVILAATLLPQGGTPAPNAPTVLTVASPDGDRRVELADGSVAIMRKGSRLAFGDFTKARQVRLLQGEAHFTVSKRSPKPFFVHAGRVSVRDIGTAFFVGLASSGIQVRVTEGQVEVSAPTSPTATSQPKRQLLVEGQQATVSVLSPTEPDAPFIATTSEATTPASAVGEWRSRRLHFDRAPLADVVEQLNRYNVRQLRLADAAIGQILLSGTLQSDNLEAFARLLADGFELHVSAESERSLLVRSR